MSFVNGDGMSHKKKGAGETRYKYTYKGDQKFRVVEFDVLLEP